MKKKKPLKLLVGDFETRNYKIPEIDAESSVWLWAVAEVSDSKEALKVGETVETFIKFMNEMSKKNKIKCYFHNLAFDGTFIIPALHNMGYSFSIEQRADKLKPKEYGAIISDEGIWYSVFWRSDSGTVEIADSLKLIPFKVAQIAKSFDLGECKGDIDYDMHRPHNWKATPEELDYIRRDVVIVARAIHKFQEITGCSKDTIASCALEWYTTNILGKGDAKAGRSVRKELFPSPSLAVDEWLRKAYHGGFCFVNPKTKGNQKAAEKLNSPEYKKKIRSKGEDVYAAVYGKERQRGCVMDVNSLYPSAMASENNLFPVGRGEIIKGNYADMPETFKKTKPVYFQHIRAAFSLKDNKVPSIQVKHDLRFEPNEYVTDTDDQMVDLYLFKDDVDRFFSNYEVWEIEYVEFIAYYGKTGDKIFGGYIDYWMNMKIKGKKEGNKVIVTIAKLFLNSLYGRFGKAFMVNNSLPIIHDGVTRYEKGKEITVDNVMIMEKTGEHYQETFSYVAMAAAITSYAREVTMRAIDACYDYFLYSDTDSVHLFIPAAYLNRIVPGFEVDPYALGKWDVESEFYLDRMNCYEGAKRYLECVTEEFYEDGKYKNNIDKDGNRWHIACCGLSESCYPEVIKYINRGENPMADGKEYYNKLAKKRVRGGTVLSKTVFKMHQSVFAR